MNYTVALPDRGVLAAWRDAARRAISHRIAPQDIDWTGGGSLFGGTPLPADPGQHQAHVRQAFFEMAESIIWHREPERFALLYQCLWRLDVKDGDPLSAADPLGKRLSLMAKSVRRDIHKMHAFVRFRELPSSTDRRRFRAWFEPEHNTLEPGSAFFAKRFGDMDWLIATPALTARFVGGELSFTAGMSRPDLPEDASEALWGTYFTNIFNPARVKLDAMRSEMPRKYWHNLPETRLIPQMLADAEERVQRMQEAGSSAPRPGAAVVSARYRSSMPQAPELPASLDEAGLAALQCRRCGLCEAATQTVWGEGAPDAPLMIVGEQPGDHEDLAGRPFVGPAGQLLHELMVEAGIDPGGVWLTNAVKHFKFTPNGKRRLHQSPNRTEVSHCRWWLGLELGFVRSQITLALGATAAFALTGNSHALSDRRGTLETGLHGGKVLISWHPAYILRLQSPQDQQIARRELAGDLRAAMALSLADQS